MGTCKYPFFNTQGYLSEAKPTIKYEQNHVFGGGRHILKSQGAQATIKVKNHCCGSPISDFDRHSIKSLDNYSILPLF